MNIVQDDNLCIEDYAQYLDNDYRRTTPDVRIYYKDGSVKEIFEM